MTKEMAAVVSVDKKANVQYWDALEDSVFECIKGIMGFSTTKIPLTDDELINELLSDGTLKEVTEKIVDFLTEKGGVFPYVDCNY